MLLFWYVFGDHICPLQLFATKIQVLFLVDCSNGSFYGIHAYRICVICFGSFIWLYIWYFNRGGSVSSNALKLVVANDGQNIYIWNIWYFGFGNCISDNNLKEIKSDLILYDSIIVL
jgi:hypothetical protein